MRTGFTTLFCATSPFSTRVPRSKLGFVPKARAHDDREQAEPVADAGAAAAPPVTTAVEALQRSAGNHAVARLLAREPAPTAEADPALVDPVPKEAIDELKDPANSVYGVKMPITVELIDLLTPKSHGKGDKREKPEGGGKYAYTKFSGAAFVKGKDDKGVEDPNSIDPNDVKQGQLGDCYLLASMAAIARANPEAIRRLVSGPNPDGTFNVTIYSDTGGAFSTKWTPKTVKVTPTFPSFTSGGPAFAERGDIDPAQGGPELWVMLIEKAYAQLKGGYEDIGGGGDSGEALEAITGKKVKEYDLDDYKDFQIEATLELLTSNGHAITASPRRPSAKSDLAKEQDAAGVIRKHAYTLLRYDKASKQIILRNPWGYDDPKPLSPEEFRKFYATFKSVPTK
jgi:Calpain family cysteine protease